MKVAERNKRIQIKVQLLKKDSKVKSRVQKDIVAKIDDRNSSRQGVKTYLIGTG